MIVKDATFEFYEFVVTKSYLESINKGIQPKERLEVYKLVFEKTKQLDYLNESSRLMIFSIIKTLMSRASTTTFGGSITKLEPKKYKIFSTESNEFCINQNENANDDNDSASDYNIDSGSDSSDEEISSSFKSLIVNQVNYLIFIKNCIKNKIIIN